MIETAESPRRLSASACLRMSPKHASNDATVVSLINAGTANWKCNVAPHCHLSTPRWGKGISYSEERMEAREGNRMLGSRDHESFLY